MHVNCYMAETLLITLMCYYHISCVFIFEVFSVLVELQFCYIVCWLNLLTQIL